MKEIQTYKELDVWKQAKSLAVSVYDITTKFPRTEVYGLTSQLRRAAVSVPSNIAEGCGRSTSKGTAYFLYIARGSLFEIETQLMIAAELNYAEEQTLLPVLNQIESCRKLLHGYIRYHESKITRT